jgi:hypothetical protein
MMLLEPPPPLNGWQDFYVIIGSSAAALTGLNFVVVALSADARSQAGPGTVSAFATPTIVHFGAVLLMAAIITAPWPSRAAPAWALGSAGVVGLLYAANVVRHTRRQKDYKPVAEDWIFHIVLPIVSYAALTVGGFLVRGGAGWPMFVVAAGALMLMYIGIHNAWDSATFLAYRNRREQEQPPQ